MTNTAIPFVGPFYELDSVNADSQRCLNWYPEFDISGMGKYGMVLKPRPGLKEFADLTGGGAVRGLYTSSSNRFFGVCGDTFSEMTSLGVDTAKGTINSIDGIVRMTNNDTQLIVVDGSLQEGWIYDLLPNTFTAITDVVANGDSSTYPGGTHVAFIDQYFIINVPNTQQYQYSALNDGSDWPTLNSVSSESSPDNINSLIALGGELWVFGPDSFEVHASTGITDDAFLRIPGTANDIGNAAPDSLAKSDKNVFWLGANDNGHGRVYMNSGYQPLAISTNAIDQVIQRYSTIDDAIGYCYQQLGHDFYVLNFPTAKATWVFDLSTGLWHERDWRDSNNNPFMMRGIVQDFFNEKVYLGDWGSSRVYELDPDTFDDFGDEIHRERTSPHIWNNLERAYYAMFQLDFEPGVGLNGTSTDKPGTITVSDGSPAITGVDTSFLTELSLNDELRWVDDFNNGQIGFVMEIVDNINATLHANATADATTVTYQVFDSSGVDPQIMLQISNDGGHTYGNEKWRGAGKLGEFKRRAKWNRLGTSRDRVFRIMATDPVKWVILGAFVEVE